ncbi:MAG: hypothetical protein ACXAEU_05870 [Candidatus Hodarchaeales archaeon]
MLILEMKRLANECASCKRCRLHESRKQVVFGEGKVPAMILPSSRQKASLRSFCYKSESWG